MYKKIMPIGWHILNKIQEKDLYKLGMGNVKYFRKYWGNIKDGLENSIQEKRDLLTAIEGKKLDDIKQDQRITRFSLCGQCDFAVVQDLRDDSDFLHACRLLPPELRDYLSANQQCVIARGPCSVLAKCEKGLRNEIATLYTQKKRVDAHYDAFCKAEMYADEKPCFPFARGTDHFAPGEKVVFFVGDMHNSYLRNTFVRGTVQGRDPNDNSQIIVVADIKLHNAYDFYDGRGMMFGYISPELMKEKEYLFFQHHQGYKELWLKVAQNVSGANIIGMATAFALAKRKNKRS